MALTEKLEFLLTANPSQAVTAFQRVGQESSKSLTAVESNIAKIGATMSKIGAAGVGIGGLLTVMSSGDIEAANQLKAAVAGVGESYDQYAAKLEATAAAQAKFGHTDEEATGALATLTTAYSDAGAAINRMQLVEDIAAARHVSLASAADMVAKAHGGSAKIFKTFGIQVQENIDGSKNYEGALDELSKRLSGQAAGSVDSFTGHLKVLAAEGENIVSGFGQNFGPAILGLSSVMMVTGPLVSGGAKAFGYLGTAASAATEKLLGTRAAVESLNVVEGESKVATLGFGSALAGLGIGAGIGAGIYMIGDALGQIPDAGKDATKAIKDLSELAGGEALRKFNDLDGFTKNITFQELIDGGDQGVGVLVKLRDAAAAAGQGTGVYDAAIQRAQSKQEQMNATVTAGQTALGDTTGTDAQTESLKKLQQSAKDTGDAYDKVLAAYMRLLPASLQVQAGPDKIAASQSKIDEAKSKLGTGTTDAENAQFQRDYNDAIRDGQSAVNDYANAQVALQVAQDAAIGKTDSTTDQTYMLRSAFGNIADSLNGPVHDAIDLYLTDLDAIAAKQQFIAAIAYGEALKAAAAGGDLGAQNTYAKLSGTGGYDQGTGAGGRRASGGPVWPGTWLVGERGPELLQLGGYGHVTNAADTAAAMAKAGGSSAPIVHLSQTVAYPEVADAAARGTTRALMLSRRS